MKQIFQISRTGRAGRSKLFEETIREKQFSLSTWDMNTAYGKMFLKNIYQPIGIPKNSSDTLMLRRLNSCNRPASFWTYTYYALIRWVLHRMLKLDWWQALSMQRHHFQAIDVLTSSQSQPAKKNLPNRWPSQNKINFHSIELSRISRNCLVQQAYQPMVVSNIGIDNSNNSTGFQIMWTIHGFTSKIISNCTK